jgi:hypothetical protein
MPVAQKGGNGLNFPEPTDRRMVHAPVGPALLACAAGLIGLVPIGLVVFVVVGSIRWGDPNWYAMALTVLAIIPFLLALVLASARGRAIALALAGFWGGVVGAVLLASSKSAAFFWMSILVFPIVALGLLLGLISFSINHHRAQDGFRAFATLGLSPAGSTLFVGLAELLVRSLHRNFPVLLAVSPPVFVFDISVAIAACATFAVAVSVLRRRQPIPSKWDTREEGPGFDYTSRGQDLRIIEGLELERD